MRLPARVLLRALIVALAPLSVSAQSRDARQLYAQFCASCHGADLNSGMGGSLIDNVWKHGADDASIARLIRDGAPTAGMPSFQAAFNEAEIQGLVRYIREQARVAPKAPAAPAKSTGRVTRTEAHAYRVELVAEDLEVPWSIAFLPDGRILLTERDGRLRVIENGQLLPRAIEGIPRVWANGQGGLLAVAPHPDYARNGWIYLSFSDPGANGTAMTKVVRGKLRDGRWVDEEKIFQAPPELYKRGGNHFGSRFVFDGEHLFFSIGERGAKDDAQDLRRPNGKVHRIYHDGRVPEDNPFTKTPGAFPTIWSYGNRNPQGLARDPVRGGLWETEHGPRGGDELNLIQRGKNYGWPVITYGINYNGTPITDKTAVPGLEQPVVQWTPSLAVCGLTFYSGDQFPQWKNNLLVGALAFEQVRRLVIENDRVTKQEIIFQDQGRVRDVAVSPDGYIYISLEQPGRIVRLVPAE